MNSDIDLTANFEDMRSVYSFTLLANDSNDSLELAFGQKHNATNCFDDEVDKEAPPPPPEGAFNVYFETLIIIYWRILELQR